MGVNGVASVHVERRILLKEYGGGFFREYFDVCLLFK